MIQADATEVAPLSALGRERSSADADELEQLKRGFVNTLVRDVRLPLTNLLGLLELFDSKLQSREPFDLEDRQLLTSVIAQGGRMRRVVDDLLEVTRGHEQKLSLNCEQVLVAHLLEEALEPFRGEAALRGVELKVDIAPTATEFYVDVRQARRALCNLLSAALAATSDGGRVVVEAQSMTGTRAGDEGRRFIIISVTDTGAGFAPQEVPFIFDAFWSASKAERSAGHGASLAVTKRIAAAHGGNVSVRSQLGAGTTYSILFPSSQLAEEAGERAAHVLVVDDAPELRLLLGKLIARMGYQVTTAATVERALEVFRERRVDLVITDWAMPEADGGEFISALRRGLQRESLPVIVLTAHDTDADRRDAETVGCNRFLVKPVMRDELQNVIEEMLAQSRKIEN